MEYILVFMEKQRDIMGCDKYGEEEMHVIKHLLHYVNTT